MKKIISLLLAFTFAATLLTACSTAESSSAIQDVTSETSSEVQSTSLPAESETAAGSSQPGSGMGIDASGKNVVITLPSAMFEETLGVNMEEYVAELAADPEVLSAALNAAGDIEMEVTQEAYAELLAEMKDAIQLTIDNLLATGEMASLKEISFNDDVSEFTIVVDVEAFENSLDVFAIMGLAYTGMRYQVFTEGDTYAVTFTLVDAATGEVYDTMVYPE